MFRRQFLAVLQPFGNGPILKIKHTLGVNPSITADLRPAGFLQYTFIQTGMLGHDFQIAIGFALIVLANPFEIGHHKSPAGVGVFLQKAGAETDIGVLKAGNDFLNTRPQNSAPRAFIAGHKGL